MLFSWLSVPSQSCQQTFNWEPQHVTIVVYIYIYIYSIPPDDGLQTYPKHIEIDWGNKLRINSASCWFYYVDVSRCTVNKTYNLVVISYRRFGTSYRFHLQGSKILNMVPTGCPETSVRNYHYSLRNNPEERSSHLLRGGNVKPRVDKNREDTLHPRRACHSSH